MRQSMNFRGVTKAGCLWLSLTLVLLAASAAQGYDGTGALRMWSDCAAFRMAPGSANGYVEFYFEMKRADFDFRRLDDLIRADVYTWVRVTDSAGVPIDSIGGAFVAVVDDSTQLIDSNFTLFFVRALELRPGLYRARTVLTDLADKASSEAEFPFRVPDYSSPALTLSDVQFGYDINHVTADTVVRPFDVLVKNQYKIFPDCRGLVSPSRPRLYFYLEAYNLAYDSAGDGKYSVEFSIVPTDGSPAKPLGPQTLTKPGSSAVLASAISVRDLPAGVYRFRADVTDPSTAQKSSVEKPFQVVAMVSDTLTDEEIRQLRDIMAYIARPSELQTFDAMNPVGKNNFMVQFWKDRDPSPGTPENEFKDEHLRRMNFANQRFSVGFKTRTDGWRTDQGRVYIVYGPPDQVDRFPFTAGREAAEKWSYESLPNQGAAYFLFVDETGFGEYRLVHSTARGEKRDPVWERRIQAGEFERGR